MAKKGELLLASFIILSIVALALGGTLAGMTYYEENQDKSPLTGVVVAPPIPTQPVTYVQTTPTEKTTPSQPLTSHHEIVYTEPEEESHTETIRDQINDIEDDVSGADDDLDSLQDDISDAEDDGDIEDLRDDLDKIHDKLKDLEDDVDALQRLTSDEDESDDLDDLEQDIEDLLDDIDSIEDEISERESELELEQDLDDDDDGVLDTEDVCAGYDDHADADSDGTPDGCDTDDDNDGVLDSIDICAGHDDTIDTDEDGTPDGCDPTDDTDSDGDGIPDTSDQCEGYDDTIDVDSDGIPDGCDSLIDSDEDGVADSEDVCAGYDDAVDSDDDGIPDGCDLIAVIFIDSEHIDQWDYRLLDMDSDSQVTEEDLYWRLELVNALVINTSSSMEYINTTYNMTFPLTLTTINLEIKNCVNSEEYYSLRPSARMQVDHLAEEINSIQNAIGDLDLIDPNIIPIKQQFNTIDENIYYAMWFTGRG